MSEVTLHHGDNRESLRQLIDEGVRVHSVVTDPPYGLVSTVKRFGSDKAAPAKSNGPTGAFKRASAGFMGSKWDGTGIERDPEFWALIYEILLPGGYVLAFSSPRTGHWQACAMEMAGFTMHPFFGWTYGSGFPKAHNAAGAIDRHLGHGNRGSAIAAASSVHPTTGEALRSGDHLPPYEARSPEAEQWEGWAYGAQSMKPALEPIYFGQKPFSEKNGALNLLKHGVGAVNIDGCRVPGEPVTIARRGHSGDNGIFGADDRKWERVNDQGRHPANLLHDGSDDVLAMFPAKAGAQAPVKGTEQSDKTDNCYGEFASRAPSDRTGDSGSAARFFNSFPIDENPLFYQSKATKADRAGSKHPTVKPIPLMQWLCRLVTPPGGIVLDPFGGSGTTGEAARREGFDCILMEAEDQFAADIRRRFGMAEPDPLDAMFG